MAHDIAFSYQPMTRNTR